MRPYILGICAGNGVLLHPMKDQVIGNIEPRAVYHTKENYQWKLNFRASSIDKNFDVRYQKKMVNVIMGHPDCGHSSILSYSRKKSLGNPKENLSLIAFINSIEQYQPDVFLLENLPKLLDNMDVLDYIDGYHFKLFQESVTAWGNSQVSRIRLVIIGVRKDIPKQSLKYFKLPEPQEVKTSKQLIKDLVKGTHDCHFREADDHYVCLYYRGKKKITLKLARQAWQEDFKGLSRWPVEDRKFTNQPGIYRNLAHRPPFTVRKQDRQFNHKGYIMTPRELARIQGIPDNFKIWYDPEKSKYSLNKGRVTIGKSPPYEIGLWFRHCLTQFYENLSSSIS